MNSLEFFSKSYRGCGSRKSYFTCLLNISQYAHSNILERFRRIHNLRLILDEKHPQSLHFTEKKIVNPSEGFRVLEKNYQNGRTFRE